jgi:exodeoxyribonuclease-3
MCSVRKAAGQDREHGPVGYCVQSLAPISSGCKLISPSEGPIVRLSLATWNINSVRLRLPLVLQFLSDYRPHVLCLQETKCPDAVFPAAEFRKNGYEHIAINGQKGYHGVATISRLPFAAQAKRDFCGKSDARHMGVTLAATRVNPELSVHNFYVPAGGDEANPEINAKFAHKLAFLDEMSAWFALESPPPRAVLVGDLNVAPLEHDVWNHKALLAVVSHTPIEVERLARVLDAGRWCDAMRAWVPSDQKLYTWWSYRSPNWEAANKGRRLDHIWLSTSLSDQLTNMRVVRAARSWDRPSDHVPVIIDLEL